ncbi:hypothetical protein H1R20_g5754, partial [Candolleomyces eurysporus]
MPSPLLELVEVSQTIANGDVLFDDINLKIYEADIISEELLRKLRPSLLPGTPSDFLRTILGLNTHQAHLRASGDDFDTVLQRATDIAGGWGINSKLWDRAWSHLSGGEAQRLLLAAAIALDTAEVLLLDGE